ncbi:MAG: GTP-binding protein [Alphaproteobacteria bacterium]|nr:GTP-binding protein [Alphaproteobacteria bacterium]
MERLPVSVLTGFLGSGKTTLLNHLVRAGDLKDAAVIINEFGAISLDHELIERTDGDVIEIKGGCLCCTVRGDLIEALRSLLFKRERGEVRRFDRVVIETTGLADPAPVLHTLVDDPLAFTKFRLDGVVTTIDAVNGAATLDAHEEAVKQAAMADRLLLTKCDLAADTHELRSRLAQLNPGADVIDVVHGRIDGAQLFNIGPFDPAPKDSRVIAWMNAETVAAHDRDHEHDHHHHDVNRHDDHIRSFCLTADQPIERMRLQFFTQLLGLMRGPDLLRVKGIIDVAERPGEPAVIHGVQHVFHPITWLKQWPSDDRRTRIVFIVRDIERHQIDELFKALIDRPSEEKTHHAHA